jgi:hypothetical protein
VSLNLCQGFYASNNGSGGNPSANNDASGQMNFTFTWGSDSQKIVQGEFRLKVSIKWDVVTIVENVTMETLTMYIEASDDDYEGWDYIGLVFDTNQDGHIDVHDDSIALFANNMTQWSVLCEHGFLGFAEMMPMSGPQRVSFDPDTGYIFAIQFPCWCWGQDPMQSLKKEANNPIHICFYDNGLAKVFVRFLFYIPEGQK